MASIPKETPIHLYVGTYAQSNEGGIYHLILNSETGQLEINDYVDGVINPSYLTIDPINNRLYSVSESGTGGVISYSIDKTSFKLKEINRRSTNGADPCYVSLDSKEGNLYFVNYSGGSLGIYRVSEDGALGELSDFIQLTGQSVNTDRQEAPHPHTIVSVPSQPLILVTDLGSDIIKLFQVSLEGTFILKSEVSTIPGSGPRHIAFHPKLPLFYVIQELDSTVAVFELNSSTYQMTQLQTISTLPSDFTESNITADIHISHCGNFLYGSNRGHDSIATYRILNDGSLEMIGYTHTGGQTPRNFMITPNGNHLLVANQDSDSIVVMEFAETGIPKLTDNKIMVPKPVCIKAY